MPAKKSKNIDEVDFALMARDISDTKKDVTEARKDIEAVKSKLESNYATKEWVEAEFGQTKKIVNAIIVTFGTAVIVAISAFIIRGGLK